MEIVTGDRPFKAAVTFISEFEVRANIDECIEAACLAATEGQPDSKIAAALLTHHEQRFRLSYVLGDWSDEETPDEDDFTFDTDVPAASGNPDEEDRVSEQERRANAARVAAYLDRVRALAAEISEQTAADFGPFAEQQTPDDKAAWLELYSDRLFENEEFAKLSLDIRDDVENRFEFLDPENLERSATGWPVVWTFETPDRELFLRKVRWFSSNHYRQFGRLLTPLVDGVRVRGPFHPLLPELHVAEKLVLLDGEGLFGGLDREIGAIPSGVIREMNRLLFQLQSAVAPEKPAEAAPIYTTSGLELVLRDAVDSFLRPWEARLGLAYRDGIRAEHHTRVKALSRRFANAWGDEYDNLRPASDLIGRLQEEISRWLDSPAGWTRRPVDDEERMAALNPVRNAVFSALHDLVKERLSEQHRSDWLNAYTYSGRGSAFLRAGEIRRIYEDSAPPISSAMKPPARAFLTEVIGIVKSGVEQSGGHFEVPKAA